MNVAINGFGRIGRATFKALLDKKGIKVVAINDLTSTDALAHLLKYDTCYGTYGKKVASTKDSIVVDGVKYPVYAEKDPAALPWAALKVDVVIESTGRFVKKDDAALHLKAGAKKVIISAPGKGDLKTIVLGVNEDKLTKKDSVFSMASCTTNCLAPVTSVIEKNFGIVKAIMSTVHSYTADQNLVDGPHRDLRRARAAAMNIVPTTTGAAVAVAETIPSLKGKFDGGALRVPTPTGSLCDVVFVTKKQITAELVNATMMKASKEARLKGILAIATDPIVSSDIVGHPASAIFDQELTKVVGGDLLKIVVWYDNEWGYSCRLADLCEFVNKKKLL